MFIRLTVIPIPNKLSPLSEYPVIFNTDHIVCIIPCAEDGIVLIQLSNGEDFYIIGNIDELPDMIKRAARFSVA